MPCAISGNPARQFCTDKIIYEVTLFRKVFCQVFFKKAVYSLSGRFTEPQKFSFAKNSGMLSSSVRSRIISFWVRWMGLTKKVQEEGSSRASTRV